MTKRQRQILSVAEKSENKYAFAEGAKWADLNPKTEEKALYAVYLGGKFLGAKDSAWGAKVLINEYCKEICGGRCTPDYESYKILQFIEGEDYDKK